MSGQSSRKPKSSGDSSPSKPAQEASFRNVDVKAIGRMLHWSLELLDCQRGMILSALEVVEGRQPPDQPEP